MMGGSCAGENLRFTLDEAQSDDLRFVFDHVTFLIDRSLSVRCGAIAVDFAVEYDPIARAAGATAASASAASDIPSAAAPILCRLATRAAGIPALPTAQAALLRPVPNSGSPVFPLDIAVKQ